MAQARSSIGRGALKDVEEQFRSWRSSRKRGEKIPLSLWQAAIELAEQYSLDEIAAVLALDCDRLKKRAEAASHRQTRPEGTAGAAGHRRFVDMGTLSAGCPDECTVEAEDGAGKKLKVHLRGDGCTQALEIAKSVTNALWSTGR